MTFISSVISNKTLLLDQTILNLFEKELGFKIEKHNQVKHIFYPPKKFRPKEIARCISSSTIILNEKYKNNDSFFWLPILAHEHCHIEQYLDYKLDIFFRIQYDIKRIIKGYANLKEEKEAYSIQQKIENYLLKNPF